MRKSFSKLIVCVCLLLIYGTIFQTCNARHASNAPKISAKSITKSRPPKSSPKSSPKSPSKPSSPSSPFKPSAPSSTSYSNEGSWKAPSFSNSDYGYGFNTPKKPTSSPSTSNSYGIPNFSVSGTSSSNKQNTPSPVSNSHTNPIGFENYQRNSMSTPSPVSNSHTNPIGFENYQRNSLSNRTNAVQPFNFNPSVSGTNSSNKFVSSYPASTSHSNATLFGTGISNHQQSGMSNFTNTLHPSNSNHSVFATNSSNKFVTSHGFSTSYNNATMLGTGVWNHQPSGASNFTNTFLPFNSNYSAFATNSGNKFWIPSPISTSYDTINVFPRLTGSYQTYPYYYYYYHQPHYYPRHYYRSTYPVTVIRNSSPKYFYPITQQNWNEIPEKCIMQRGPLSPTIPASFPEVSFNNTIELLAKNSKTYSNNLESKTHDAKMTTYADEGKPWLAALGFRNANLSAENIDSYEIEWRCGGSLVHSEYILTAAHCFYVPGLTLSVVRLGAIDLVHEKNNSPKPLDVDVENATIIIHPCFHSFLLTNDIALIKLKSKINDRRPINLPFTLTSLHTVMDPVRMWGWGPTFEKGNNTALRFVDMHLLPLEKCYSVRNITDGEICAGMGVGGRNSCQGDSGGPLTWRESVGSPEYLLGVISTGGADCRKPNVANVYTNVMKYWKWMNCHFTKNTSCKQ